MRPGYLAPGLLVALAVAGSGVLAARWADERVAAHEIQAVRADAATLAADPAAPVAGGRVVEATATGPLPFQRRLRYASHPTRAGQALTPDEADDKAAADAFTAATHGAGTDWELPAGRRAAALVQGGGVALVDRPAPPRPGAPVGPLLGAALLGFLLWIMVLRRFAGRAFAPALGATLAAAPVLGVLGWSTRALAERFPVAGPASLAGDLALLFAAALAPLVAGAVAGAWSRGRRSPHRVAYAYVVPAMAGMAALVLVPFGLGVLLAFTRHHAGTFTWVGLANFVDILSGGGQPLWAPLSFYFTLVVTLLWTGLNVALHVAIGLGLALLLRAPDLRFKGLYRVLLIVPWAVPNYITALIWKGMFNKQYGLINEVLGLVGVEPVGWFSSFWTAFAANLTTNTWLGFPFMMVVALGALQSIPADLEEAAEVDGAGRWARFRHITLPLLKPALFPAVILGSIWTFNMFNIIYLVSGGQPEGATDILITEAYRWAFEQDRHGYAAAYSVLIFFILLAWSLLTQRATRGAEEAHG